MYSKGDYVIYRCKDVCKVTDIGLLHASNR